MLHYAKTIVTLPEFWYVTGISFYYINSYIRLIELNYITNSVILQTFQYVTRILLHKWNYSM